MTSRSSTFIIKKSPINNGRGLWYARDYTVAGEEACMEVHLIRYQDKTGYQVAHFDFLEKFVDILHDYFTYEFFEFDDFEQAVVFIQEKFAIPLEKMK